MINKDILSIDGISEKEYRALPYESYSSIKHLLDSPQTFLFYKENPFRGSDSTLLGTAVHNYIQGNRHLVSYSIIDKRKKEEYAEYEKSFREMAGEEGIIVPKSFEEKISAIMKNFHDNSAAIKLLQDCQTEKPFLFNYNGITLKGKVDGVKCNSLVEIKTTSMSQDIDSFRREAYSRDYDLQAFLYWEGLNGMESNNPTPIQEHYFLVCGTTAPYSVKLYRSSDRFYDSGKQKADVVTDRYKRHILNGEPFNENDNIPEL